MGLFNEDNSSVALRFFEEISSIPRPSYHENLIADYLVDFARQHSLEHYRDKLNNVIIIKEASLGYENEPAVILQGHSDMVCVKDSDCDKDMLKEGLDLVIDGDILYANGTSLGADDGVAIAYALAILSSDSIKHPRIEFACTVCEEVGMEGAAAIDLSNLKGHTLINIDSETEGEALCGCAGGGLFSISLSVMRSKFFEGIRAGIEVGGLSGGHSGEEIDKGRGNAIFILAQALRYIYNSDNSLALISLSGGEKDNAIPKFASANITVSDIMLLKDTINKFQDLIKEQYRISDPNLYIKVTPCTSEDKPLSSYSSLDVISFLATLPDGVIKMSNTVDSLVETSLNLGVCNISDDKLNLKYCVRSSVPQSYKLLIEKLIWLSKSSGATYSISGEYPAWPWARESRIREKFKTAYKELFNKELYVCAIHAGVECGLLMQKIPNLDAISIGPDAYDIHTTSERMSISSFERVFKLLTKVLEDKS